jgi:Zn-dependent protease with chaperone function
VSPLFFAPLGLVVIGLLAGWYLPRVAGPAACVRALTATVLVVGSGAALALLLTTATAAANIHSLSSLAGWCRALYPADHGIAPGAGLVAGALVAVSIVRGGRYLRRARREVAGYGVVDGVEVVRAAGPVAFAVPGRPGGVILGDELLLALDTDERRVVLAHEQAHLDHHHHRYVRIAEAGAAAFPFLAPLARQVRFNTERWADEVAAVRVGSRTTVARTIAKVALLGTPPASAHLAFGRLGTGDRVDALLAPPASPSSHLTAVAATATILVPLAGSSVQVHHLATFLAHVCPV